jgi:phosphohistidine phosphatase
VRVFLVRHAQAAPGQPDELRKLTARGRDQARELGERLDRDGVQPDVILSSPLLRARETAAVIAKEIGANAEADDRLGPGCTVQELRRAVAGRGETVVVVAHQPDCGQIAAAVTGGPEPDFPTAGVVELELA